MVTTNSDIALSTKCSGVGPLGQVWKALYKIKSNFMTTSGRNQGKSFTYIFLLKVTYG